MGFLWQNFSIQDTPLQLEVVAFSKELPELGWVSQFIWAQAQGPILHPHNHMAQEGVCPLSLLPIAGGHAGDLQTVFYQVQDAQVAAVCLNRTHGSLKGWPPAWLTPPLQ